MSEVRIRITSISKLSVIAAREKRNASDVEVRDKYLKTRQYEQPGELVTLPNGLQYREIESGRGETKLKLGAICEVSYIVYRLSSGAYFKYSSGGTPVYMFSMGYGFEGKDDLDSVYQFRYGDESAVPLAAGIAMEGMRIGGRRRILIPPRFGWIDRSVGPRPDTFGGYRRLEAHKDEPLLFEVEIKRIQQPINESASSPTDIEMELPEGQTEQFRLPTPPSALR